MRIKVRLEIIQQEINIIGLENQEIYTIDENRQLVNTGLKSAIEYRIGTFSKENSFYVDSIEVSVKDIDLNKGIIEYNKKQSKVIKSERNYLMATTSSSVKRGIFHNVQRAKNALEQMIFQYEERTKFRMYPMSAAYKMFLLVNDDDKKSALLTDTCLNITDINKNTQIVKVGYSPTVIVNLNYNVDFDYVLIELYSDIPLKTICTDLTYFKLINDIKEFLDSSLSK